MPSENSESAAIRQAAAVFLKNLCEKHWETYDDSVPSLIPETDKAILRGSIVEAVVAASEPIRVQLLTVVRRMVRSDFPVRWGNALDQMVPLLQSGDVNRITCGLSCFLEVVSWRGGKEMKEVTEAVQSQVFPMLLQLGQEFLKHIEEPAAQLILKTILKCYFTAIQFRFSNWLLGGEAFLAWCQLSLAVIQSAVPAAIQALPRDELHDSRYWKMKKWAFHIQNKLMSRWGNSKLDTHAGGAEVTEFARAYMANMVLPVLQVYLAQCHAAAEGRVVLPDRVVCLLCDFLENCLKAKKTWEALKPQAEWLIQGFVFPRLCWTEADAELWSDDAHEFIRTRLDPFDDFYSPAAACINLVVAMVKQRRKDIFMPLLAFANGLLSQAGGAPAEQRDGALYLVGSLATLLLDSKRMRGQMEGFISAFVLPELQSPQAHLRLRACWVLQQFDELQYAQEQNAVAALSGVLGCLSTDGPDALPVRVAAATALAALLDNAVVAAQVKPYLPRIVETILSLAGEIELDSLSYVLEDIVTQFSEEMAPWAAQLCMRLRETLMRSIENYDPEALNEDGEVPGMFDDTDKMMAVLGMLGTLTSLVDSMAGKQETMAQLEAILLPMLHTILSRRLLDVYEEAFSLLDSLTYGQKAISAGLWELLPVLHAVFIEAGSSYLPDMATGLENYISYGAAHLVQQPEAMNRLIDMIRLTMTSDEFVESDWVHGCNLIESLFLHCPRGSINGLLSPLLRLIVDKMADSKDGEPGLHAASHRVQHVEAILAALQHSPAATISELEAMGATQVLLARWTEAAAANSLVRVHDKKMTIVAMGAVMNAAPLESLPAAWQQHWPALMTAFLQAVETLPKALETRQKLKEESERPDEDREQRLASDDEDDEDDEDYDPRHRGGDAGGDDEFEEYNSDDWPSDDEDWEDADELEEDPYFETPLDAVDGKAIATEAVRAAARAQPAVFQQIAMALPPAQQTVLHSLLQ